MAGTRLVPDWLRTRLHNEISQTLPTIRYECYLYGPLNEYLHSIFPNDRSFMVAPQLYLRLEHDGKVSSVTGSTGGSVGNDTDDGDDDDDGDGEDGDSEIKVDDDASWADISKDNFGDFVKSRNLGRETKLKVPDFIVVKATASIDNDTLIALVEVKKNDETKVTSMLQMRTYMKRAAPKGNRPAQLLGFLVLGAQTSVFQLESASHDAGVTLIGENLSTDGGVVENYLRTIATQYWN